MTGKKIRIELVSEQATEDFGIQLGRLLLPGDTVCLEGGLGSGKTTMTQAIGRGLDVEHDCYINSPTFNILHEYTARLPLFHMDFYRLTGSDDVLDMGLDEYFFKGGVTVIEWASKAVDVLPDERIEIALEPSGTTGRTIRITAFGDSWSKRADRLVSGLEEVR